MKKIGYENEIKKKFSKNWVYMGYILFMSVFVVMGLSTNVRDMLLRNNVSTTEIGIVENFIYNAKYDPAVACKDAFEVFHTSDEQKCDVITEESIITVRRWFNEDINVIGITQNTRNVYISADEGRMDYKEVRVSYMQNSSESISIAVFYVFEHEEELKLSMSSPRSAWFNEVDE